MTAKDDIRNKPKYTSLKISVDTHKRAKAAASLVDEELYEFIEISIKERLERLVSEGKITFVSKMLDIPSKP